MDLDKTLAERVAEREEKRRRQEEQRQLQEQQEQLGEHVLPQQQLTDWRDWKSVYSKFDHVDIAIEMHGLIAGVRHNQ